jgi:hypothetical protein
MLSFGDCRRTRILLHFAISTGGKNGAREGDKEARTTMDFFSN